MCSWTSQALVSLLFVLFPYLLHSKGFLICYSQAHQLQTMFNTVFKEVLVWQPVRGCKSAGYTVATQPFSSSSLRPSLLERQASHLLWWTGQRWIMRTWWVLTCLWCASTFITIHLSWRTRAKRYWSNSEFHFRIGPMFGSMFLVASSHIGGSDI